MTLYFFYVYVYTYKHDAHAYVYISYRMAKSCNTVLGEVLAVPHDARVHVHHDGSLACRFRRHADFGCFMVKPNFRFRLSSTVFTFFFFGQFRFSFR